MASLELRVGFWKAVTYPWGISAMMLAALVVWPPKEQYIYYIAAVLVLGLIIYPLPYSRRTRLVVEKGQLRVYDLSWPVQTLFARDAIELRQVVKGYWEIRSHSGTIVRIRPIWRKKQMVKVAEILGVPIRMRGDP